MLHLKKQKTYSEFIDIAKDIKLKNKTLVQCDGVFDLLHLGHVRYFAEAKNYGDFLYVVLVSDEFVRKGKNRPIFNQSIRAEFISAIEYVDYVIINNDFGPNKIIKNIKPDVLVKGAEYIDSPTEGFLKDRELVESYGGKVCFVKEMMHSTKIIENINKLFN